MLQPSAIKCEICKVLFDVVAQFEEDDMNQIINASLCNYITILQAHLQEANKACSKLPSVIANICTQLVDQLIPQLIFAEKEGLGQGEACGKLLHMCNMN